MQTLNNPSSDELGCECADSIFAALCKIANAQARGIPAIDGPPVKALRPILPSQRTGLGLSVVSP